MKIEKVKFVKVICKECKAEHVIFTKASTKVICPNCGILQNEPKGGKCKLINCLVLGACV